jgi:hypothetical protein
VQVKTCGGNDLVAVNDSNFDAAVVFGFGRGHNDLDAGTLGTPNANGNTFDVEPVIRGFVDKMS